MTIKQLEYYAEVVKQRNFTKAAEKLFVSQSALSKSIRVLEKEFQAELIDRTSKDFALTQEGMMFHEYAIKLLDYFHAQTQELYQRLHNMKGALSIGLPPTAGSIYFYSRLHEFQERYPHVALKITEIPSKTIHEMMDGGKLDLGVVLEPFTDERYHCRQVYTSEVVLVVSEQNRLASKKSASLSELQSEKFLMMSSDYMFHDIILDYCKKSGFTPNIAFESSQWDLIYEMTADHQGISFFPKCLLEKHARTQIRLLELRDPKIPWVLSICYRKDKFLTAPMRCFLDLCSASSVERKQKNSELPFAEDESV